VDTYILRPPAIGRPPVCGVGVCVGGRVGVGCVSWSRVSNLVKCGEVRSDGVQCFS